MTETVRAEANPSRHRRVDPSPETRARSAERRHMLRDLRMAIAQRSFVLDYQPRLSLRELRIRAAEALIRWPHRRRGATVQPAAFIPLAEASGLITEIGRWVLEEACREAAAWTGDAVVAVNVSARQLHDGSLSAHIGAALESSGLDPERLEIELTESMVIDTGTDTLLRLAAIRDLGVGVALDDFGTGYASLAVLKRLPLTVLKLDRTMVREVPENREDAVITRAVVETGHALGLTVVAEGIETEAQLAFLAGIGCDEGQGFLFSRALPAGVFRKRLVQ
ncbi:MAG TPA: EAL domain-containing protein [Acetobacteraceae bacterium]|nr:EAL domain-containing protein [Acetobacteraceae bacterium]